MNYGLCKCSGFGFIYSWYKSFRHPISFLVQFCHKYLFNKWLKEATQDVRDYFLGKKNVLRILRAKKEAIAKHLKSAKELTDSPRSTSSFPYKTKCTECMWDDDVWV